MSRLNRKNKTYKELGITEEQGVFDFVDNEVKILLRINDNEYDYICEHASDEELALLVLVQATFSQKRKLLITLEKYVNQYATR